MIGAALWIAAGLFLCWVAFWATLAAVGLFCWTCNRIADLFRKLGVERVSS